jgi:hypothetical protein
MEHIITTIARSARGGGHSGHKTASLKPEDQLPALHALALELRDKLRFRYDH